MDRFEAISILLAAVDTGSLSAASRQLRIPLATVSRRVSELEAHLKVRLLTRGARKLALTEAGHTYVASCRRILEELAETERVASGEYQAPQGELVISVPHVIGRNHLVSVVVEFLSNFPDIRIRLQPSDRVVNLFEDDVDLAVRLGELPDSSMIAVRVGMIYPVLCASPAYLKARGVPQTPADLNSHDCVVYDPHRGGDRWEFRVDGAPQTIQVPWRLMIGSLDAALIAATTGAGIARIVSYLAEEQIKSRALVRVLEGFELTPRPLSLIYPGQRLVPAKLRAFLDFATPRLRERLDYR